MSIFQSGPGMRLCSNMTDSEVLPSSHPTPSLSHLTSAAYQDVPSSHPTPSLSHLTSTDYQDVYEPAEDSFLLMDALEKDAALLRRLKPLVSVEVGSGSGAVITFLATLIQQPAFYWATDINPLACKCTMKTLAQNGITHCDSVTMDLMSCFRLRGKVDVMIFNPPYVVTPSEEVGGGGIEASWAGGRNGREVADRLLPDVSEFLSPQGVFYLVVLPENKPDELRKILASRGLQSVVVLARRARNERLSILRFHRPSNVHVHAT